VKIVMPKFLKHVVEFFSETLHISPPCGCSRDLKTSCSFYVCVCILQQVDFSYGRKRKQGQGSLFAADTATLHNPPRFGGFYDKDGYNGKGPSQKVLRAAWDVVFHQRQPYYRRSSQWLMVKSCR